MAQQVFLFVGYFFILLLLLFWVSLGYESFSSVVVFPSH